MDGFISPILYSGIFLKEYLFSTNLPRFQNYVFIGSIIISFVKPPPLIKLTDVILTSFLLSKNVPVVTANRNLSCIHFQLYGE